MRKSPERYTPEFKLGLVKRLLAGEVPATVAQQTGVPRRRLYQWRDQYRQHGPEGLKPFGRPRKARELQAAASSLRAQKRIADLERKIGHQEMVIDFFDSALRRLREKSEDNRHAGGSKCIS